jgi:hypothetical protein
LNHSDEAGKLFLIDEVPGFDVDGNHRDGWFSKGLFALKLSVPDCLTINVECADPELVIQPECWRIKEGVFIVFPEVRQCWRELTPEEIAEIPWGQICSPWEPYKVAQLFGHGRPIRLGEEEAI